jgi:hypothetical protein
MTRLNFLLCLEKQRIHFLNLTDDLVLLLVGLVA